jgi:hypothetical protein
MRLAGLRVCLFLLLCIPWLSALSLDREAFTFVKYDLDVRIESQQHRLGARGTITLRNDSSTPQKSAVLQISSTLKWLSIKVGGKPSQFDSQAYNTDIDHTGVLSEATVTLPEAIAPKETVELEIAYEGVVTLDATRLTRIDTPETTAHSTDWDQISAQFTAVRGVGYVAWYPIATEAASLAEGTDLFDVLRRWKVREEASTMHLKFAVEIDEGESPEFLVNATTCLVAHEVEHRFVADCKYRSIGSLVPALVIANYQVVERPSIAVHYLRGHAASAANYADAAEKVIPLVTDWFGAPKARAQTADLADSNEFPYESGTLLLTPLTGADPRLAGLIAAHQLTHAAFSSPRPWINEGLAHFAQALYLENQRGREPALDYMGLHRSAFSAIENDQKQRHSENDVRLSLVNTVDEELYRSKAMCVWWMLRDMIGDHALKSAIAQYRPNDDKEPSYMPHLIQAQTQRDLEWFFDDWVYRDRGLPDFTVASAFTRKTLPEGYMLTITVDNVGAAGAEVPLTVKFAGGEVTKRLVVRGKSNAVIRVEVPKMPQEIVVNDGSVPQQRTTNHVFRIEVAK